MQAQKLLVAIVAFGAVELSTGIALDVQRFVSKGSADKVNTTSKATVKATAIEKGICADKCSKNWVRGQTTKSQDSPDAWAKRCKWPGCGGCSRCADAAVFVQSSSIEKLEEKRVIDKESEACDSWCSGEAYAFKPWETKCSWKSCKGCSVCQTPAARASRVAAVGRSLKGKSKFVKIVEKTASAAEEDAALAEQSTRTGEAKQAAKVAESEALEAQRAAEAARADAIVKEKKYNEAKATAKLEADKLSKVFEHPDVKLPELVQTQAKCEQWCSSTQYANKSWESKCGWKDCKDCSSCAALSEIGDVFVSGRVSATEEKKLVVDRILTTVSQYIKDDTADVNGLLSSLDLAVLKTENVQKPNAVASATSLSSESIHVTVACPEMCSSSWVSGQLLDAQQSAKAWEKRCALNGCGTCPQCVASTLIVGATFGFP